jgi:hypothetical protein
MTRREGGRRYGLGFDACRHLFDNHAARFTLPASTAGGESHHAKSNDTLCLESKFHGFGDHWKPGIEHRAPFVGGFASTHASAWVDANGVNIRFGS